MKINKAFKFRIYPNSQQKQFLAQSFGCARFVFNRFLRQRIDYYAENGKGLTYLDTFDLDRFDTNEIRELLK